MVCFQPPPLLSHTFSLFPEEVNLGCLHPQLGHERISGEWEGGWGLFLFVCLVFPVMHCGSGSTFFSVPMFSKIETSPTT